MATMFFAAALLAAALLAALDHSGAEGFVNTTTEGNITYSAAVSTAATPEPRKWKRQVVYIANGTEVFTGTYATVALQKRDAQTTVPTTTGGAAALSGNHSKREVESPSVTPAENQGNGTSTAPSVPVVKRQASDIAVGTTTSLYNLSATTHGHEKRDAGDATTPFAELANTTTTAPLVKRDVGTTTPSTLFLDGNGTTSNR